MNCSRPNSPRTTVVQQQDNYHMSREGHCGSIQTRRLWCARLERNGDKIRGYRRTRRAPCRARPCQMRSLPPQGRRIRETCRCLSRSILYEYFSPSGRWRDRVCAVQASARWPPRRVDSRRGAWPCGMIFTPLVSQSALTNCTSAPLVGPCGTGWKRGETLGKELVHGIETCVPMKPPPGIGAGNNLPMPTFHHQRPSANRRAPCTADDCRCVAASPMEMTGRQNSAEICVQLCVPRTANGCFTPEENCPIHVSAPSAFVAWAVRPGAGRAWPPPRQIPEMQEALAIWVAGGDTLCRRPVNTRGYAVKQVRVKSRGSRFFCHPYPSVCGGAGASDHHQAARTLEPCQCFARWFATVLQGSRSAYIGHQHADRGLAQNRHEAPAIHRAFQHAG